MNVSRAGAWSAPSREATSASGVYLINTYEKCRPGLHFSKHLCLKRVPALNFCAEALPPHVGHERLESGTHIDFVSSLG